MFTQGLIAISATGGLETASARNKWSEYPLIYLDDKKQWKGENS